MVSKYSKMKNQTIAHKNQQQAELEKAKLLSEEFEAYQALLKNTNHQPAPGHYRTKSGSHMKIVPNGSSWTRQGVSAEEQLLPFGVVWVPYPSSGHPIWPMTIEELYSNGAPMFQLVMPQQVGFSNLGDHMTPPGVTYSAYQLNKLAVVENGPNDVGYQAVPTTTMDFSREHVRVYESGAVEMVPPIPEAYRSLSLPLLTQLQPTLAQQIPQQAEAQPCVSGPSQIPASSFGQLAVPQTWIDEEARTRSNTHDTILTGNTGFTNGEGHIPDSSLLQNVDTGSVEGDGAKVGELGQNGIEQDFAGICDFNMDNIDWKGVDLTGTDCDS